MNVWMDKMGCLVKIIERTILYLSYKEILESGIESIKIEMANSMNASNALKLLQAGVI